MGSFSQRRKSHEIKRSCSTFFPPASPFLLQQRLNRRQLWIVQQLPDAALVPRKVLRAWSPISFTTQSGRTAHPLVKVMLVPYSLFLLLVAYGAVVAFKPWHATFPLYAMPLRTTLQAAIFFGDTCYSIPIAPALILLAAVGIERLAQHLLSAPQKTALESV